ncbi:MAG: ATP-binding protein [Planctomycetota bacterium]|nr:ATP-binding protein [Planctomycetota bacterium]
MTDATPPDDAAIDALLERGVEQWREGAAEAAVETLREALSHLEHCEHDARYFRTVRNLAKMLQARGQTEEADQHFLEAERRAEHVGGRILLRARIDVVQNLVFAGRYAAARERTQPLLEDPALHAAPELHSFLLRLAGDVLLAEGELGTALNHLNEAVAIAEKHEDVRALAGAESSRGRVLSVSGDLHAAVAAYGRALDAYREVKDYASVAGTLANTALIGIDLGAFEDAERNARESLELAREVQSPRMEAGVLRILACALQRQGALAEAEVHADRSCRLAEDLGAFVEQTAGLVRLGKIQHEAGRHGEAQESLATARALGREHGDRIHETYALDALARVHLAQGDVDAARSAMAAIADERARRRKADEIRHLTARLLSAQEAEQRRIGRDLHDDLGQRLAVLSLELAQLARKQEGRDPDDQARARTALETTQAIAADVSRISHQLHPAALEHLGLTAATRGLCREMGELADLTIAFEAEADLPALDPDSALSVFRIVQEALRNVARHSGANQATVGLEPHDGNLCVTVADDGHGFDPDAPRESGIGLMSMRERAELLGGHFEIESAPGSGTTVRVSVPLG